MIYQILQYAGRKPSAPRSGVNLPARPEGRPQAVSVTEIDSNAKHIYWQTMLQFILKHVLDIN